MNPLRKLELAAQMYARQHRLTVPTRDMPNTERAAAISAAVEDAIKHPRRKHAKFLVWADRKFAQSLDNDNTKG